MSQIAVIYYDKERDTVSCSQISDDFHFESYLGSMSKKQLVNICKINNLKPINFSIDRNDEIVEDCGAFSRFSNDGDCGVILAEIHNKNGETEGYRILQCRPEGNIVNLTIDSILKKNKEVTGTFLQNGIIRENGEKEATVACYPQKPFQTITMHGEKKVTTVKKPEVKDVFDATYTIEVSDSTVTIKGKTEKKEGNIVTNATIKSTRDVGLIFATHISKKVDKSAFESNNLLAMNCIITVVVTHQEGKCLISIENGSFIAVRNATEIGLKVVDYLSTHYGKEKEEPKVIDKKIQKKDKYTTEQIREILSCRKKGISSKFIENPKLEPNQMRILWMAKSKGMFMNQVAKPEYSEDALREYADLLYSKIQVSICKPLIARPELSGPEIRALYEALLNKMDIEPLVGLPVKEIYDEIQAKKFEFWDKPFTKMDDEEFHKVLGEIDESIINTINICKEKYAYRESKRKGKK